MEQIRGNIRDESSIGSLFWKILWTVCGFWLWWCTTDDSQSGASQLHLRSGNDLTDSSATFWVVNCRHVCKSLQATIGFLEEFFKSQVFSNQLTVWFLVKNNTDLQSRSKFSASFFVHLTASIKNKKKKTFHWFNDPSFECPTRIHLTRICQV